MAAESQLFGGWCGANGADKIEGEWAERGGQSAGPDSLSYMPGSLASGPQHETDVAPYHWVPLKLSVSVGNRVSGITGN